MVVSTTLTANSAITHSTTVSLTAVPRPLGPPLDGQPAVAADQAGDEPEGRGLDRRDDHFGQAGDQGQRGEVGTGRHVLQVDAEEEAADQADDDDQAVEQHRDDRSQATTRGTTSRWMGSMPSTSIASISSRMVRAPRSAQMAVDPAPATTSTVISGPSWVTAPSAAPAPEMSAAPNCGQQDVEREDEKHGQRHRDRHGRQHRDPA